MPLVLLAQRLRVALPPWGGPSEGSSNPGGGLCGRASDIRFPGRSTQKPIQMPGEAHRPPLCEKDRKEAVAVSATLGFL